jgi:hypothetical protein
MSSESSKTTFIRPFVGPSLDLRKFICVSGCHTVTVPSDCVYFADFSFLCFLHFASFVFTSTRSNPTHHSEDVFPPTTSQPIVSCGVCRLRCVCGESVLITARDFSQRLPILASVLYRNHRYRLRPERLLGTASMNHCRSTFFTAVKQQGRKDGRLRELLYDIWSSDLVYFLSWSSSAPFNRQHFTTTTPQLAH